MQDVRLSSLAETSNHWRKIWHVKGFKLSTTNSRYVRHGKIKEIHTVCLLWSKNISKDYSSDDIDCSLPFITSNPLYLISTFCKVFWSSVCYYLGKNEATFFFICYLFHLLYVSSTSIFNVFIFAILIILICSLSIFTLFYLLSIEWYFQAIFALFCSIYL